MSSPCNGYFGVFDSYPGNRRVFVGHVWIKTVDDDGVVVPDGLSRLFELSDVVMEEIQPLVDVLLEELKD